MLTDQYNRTIDYLRISVTDRCDLRCQYCIPKGFNNFTQRSDWLTFDEIERIVAAFAHLGTTHFRLTGGEPLLRKNFPTLVKKISSIQGVEDLSVTTNGTQLSRFAKDLKEAGVHRFNVSLDSLRKRCFENITGSDSLEQVLEGLQAAKREGFDSIKINMVLQSHSNISDITQMIEFCIQNNYILRLIELMPLGAAAQSIRSFNLHEFSGELQKTYKLIPALNVAGGGPARYWRSHDGGFTLGFITPLSRHFCETCNRVRLSVTGTLYMCLGQNYTYDLRAVLRQGSSDALLEESICQAVRLKPKRHDFLEEPGKISRTMALTGG